MDDGSVRITGQQLRATGSGGYGSARRDSSGFRGGPRRRDETKPWPVAGKWVDDEWIDRRETRTTKAPAPFGPARTGLDAATFFFFFFLDIEGGRQRTDLPSLVETPREAIQACGGERGRATVQPFPQPPAFASRNGAPVDADVVLEFARWSLSPANTETGRAGRKPGAGPSRGTNEGRQQNSCLPARQRRSSGGDKGNPVWACDEGGRARPSFGDGCSVAVNAFPTARVRRRARTAAHI